MRVENVSMGYEHNVSSVKLSGKTGDLASMYAFFELQTILQPQVDKVLDRLQKEYLKQVRQAAEATNETETQVESGWTEPVSQGITR